jgi:hypothetical protein
VCVGPHAPSASKPDRCPKRAMAISSMSSLVFVTTNGTAQVPISQRGLIRSHCMREKNKQPQSRRSKREARRLQAAAAKENEKAPSTGSTPTSLSVANKSKQGGANERLAVARTRVPPAPPSDWALIKLPVELDRTSQKLFHRCKSPLRRRTWVPMTDSSDLHL